MNKEQKQVYFDAAYIGVMKQGKLSFTIINNVIHCLYRSADGCKCAIT